MDESEERERPLCSRDLLIWSYQVARGMDFLAHRKVLHGDLAARNVLLAEGNVVKISDFGLAKDLYKYNKYRKDTNSPLPVKWMSIEALRDGVFSTQSDVWAFGVVLWEIFSLGRCPYPGVEVDAGFIKAMEEGERMDNPPFATRSLYQLMLDCWDTTPACRPSFNHLEGQLSNMLTTVDKEHLDSLKEEFEEDKSDDEDDDARSGYLNMVASPDYLNIMQGALEEHDVGEGLAAPLAIVAEEDIEGERRRETREDIESERRKEARGAVRRENISSKSDCSTVRNEDVASGGDCGAMKISDNNCTVDCSNENEEIKFFVDCSDIINKNSESINVATSASLNLNSSTSRSTDSTKNNATVTFMNPFYFPKESLTSVLPSINTSPSTTSPTTVSFSSTLPLSREDTTTTNANHSTSNNLASSTSPPLDRISTDSGVSGVSVPSTLSQHILQINAPPSSKTVVKKVQGSRARRESWEAKYPKINEGYLSMKAVDKLINHHR